MESRKVKAIESTLYAIYGYHLIGQFHIHGISNNSFVMWSATDDGKKSSFRIQF